MILTKHCIMDSSDVWQQNVSLYNFLEENRCLCLYSPSRNKAYDFHKFYFENISVSGKIEGQYLLCASICRLCAEIYAEEVTNNKQVCKEILNFILFFSEENIFFNMVENLLVINDKYLSWIFIKFLSALLYGMQLPLLKTWINFIITKLMQNLSEEKSLFLFDLLISFIDQGARLSSIKENNTKCKDVVHCNLLFVKECYLCICTELAEHWKSLAEIVTKLVSTELDEQKLYSFLNLWKQISAQTLENDVLWVYLDKQQILDFLICSNHISSKGIPLYVEVIVQILCSSLKHKPWAPSDSVPIEAAVSTALSSGLLELLPCSSHEFCNSIKRISSKESLSMTEEEGELSLTSKRIIFILTNLFAEFQTEKLLCEVLLKLFDFMSERGLLNKETSLIWIIQIFLDEDDLLFGVMLASLRIYIKLQEKNCLWIKHSCCKKLCEDDLNPHKAFLHLVDLFDHNHSELLSFLVSNETCCLLYLMEYLKFLCKEPDFFFETCRVCEKRQSVQTLKKQRTYRFSVENSRFASLRNTGEGGNDFVNPNKHNSQTEGLNIKSKILQDKSYQPIEFSSTFAQSPLVTYSSSEDELEIESEPSLKNRLLKTVELFRNLREGIQKLVNIKEFPYNVSPLLSLLKKTEDLFG